MREAVLIFIVVLETILYSFFEGHEIGFIVTPQVENVVTQIDAQWYVDILAWHVIVIYSLYLATTGAKKSFVWVTIGFYMMKAALFVCFYNYIESIVYLLIYLSLCLVGCRFINFKRVPKWLKY